MRAALNPTAAPFREVLPRRLPRGNLTLPQRAKLWLAAAIFCAMAWGLIIGAVVLVCRWVVP